MARDARRRWAVVLVAVGTVMLFHASVLAAPPTGPDTPPPDPPLTETPPPDAPPDKQKPPGSKTPAQLLEDAEADFRELQYRRAEQTLRALLYPAPQKEPLLESPDDRLRARELLGACLWYLDERDKAEKEFQWLLLKQPGHALDKFVYPKPLLDFFEGVRKVLIEHGAIVPFTEPVEDKPPVPTVLRIITQREQTRASAFMPFGVAQFEQDRNGWGAFFASSQTLAALGNLGSYVAYVSVYNGGDPEVRQALFISTITTGAVWIALTAWGIIDANVTFEPLRVVRTEDGTAEQAMPGGVREPGPTPVPPP